MSTKRRRAHETSPPAEPAPSAPQEDAAPAEGGATAGSGPTTPPDGAAPPPTAPAAGAGAEARVQELEDRLRRIQAEFVNETRRIARQAEESGRFAIEPLVRDLLPVLDALHHARRSLGPAEADASGAEGGPTVAADTVRQGLDLVERALLGALARHGVEPIEATGAFDPAQHEALYVVDRPGLDPGAVAELLRPGYTIHGRVVRAAHVAVTAVRPAQAPERTEGGGAAGAPADAGATGGGGPAPERSGE